MLRTCRIKRGRQAVIKNKFACSTRNESLKMSDEDAISLQDDVSEGKGKMNKGTKIKPPPAPMMVPNIAVKKPTIINPTILIISNSIGSPHN